MTGFPNKKRLTGFGKSGSDPGGVGKDCMVSNELASCAPLPPSFMLHVKITAKIEIELICGTTCICHVLFCLCALTFLWLVPETPSSVVIAFQIVPLLLVFMVDK